MTVITFQIEMEVNDNTQRNRLDKSNARRLSSLVSNAVDLGAREARWEKIAEVKY